MENKNFQASNSWRNFFSHEIRELCEKLRTILKLLIALADCLGKNHVGLNDNYTTQRNSKKAIKEFWHIFQQRSFCQSLSLLCITITHWKKRLFSYSFIVVQCKRLNYLYRNNVQTSSTLGKSRDTKDVLQCG